MYNHLLLSSWIENAKSIMQVGLDAPQTLDAVRSWIEEIHDSEDKDLLGDFPLPEILNGLDNGIKESTEELNGNLYYFFFVFLLWAII